MPHRGLCGLMHSQSLRRPMRFRGCIIIALSVSADRTDPSSMTQEPNSERDLDTRLDEALEMTFPASDPIAVHSPDPPPRSSENRGPVERA